MIEFISPPEFEQYFNELAELFRGEPDLDKITNLAARYGCTLQMDWVPDLKAKYNVKLLGQ